MTLLGHAKNNRKKLPSARWEGLAGRELGKQILNGISGSKALCERDIPSERVTLSFGVEDCKPSGRWEALPPCPVGHQSWYFPGAASMGRSESAARSLGWFVDMDFTAAPSITREEKHLLFLHSSHHLTGQLCTPSLRSLFAQRNTFAFLLVGKTL